MSYTTLWMLRTGSFTSSLYSFLLALTSKLLKVMTPSRSLGPEPLGRWPATTSRHRASLFPRLLSLRIVAAIHFRWPAMSSLVCNAVVRRLRCSSGPVGCHMGPRLSCSSLLLRWHHQLQNSGVSRRFGTCLERTSSGKSSIKSITAFLSWSKSMKRSFMRLIPSISCHGMPSRETPSSNSCIEIFPLPLRSSSWNAFLALPARSMSPCLTNSRCLSRFRLADS
mmetsp:Transcript_53616/g.115831  ORF Transcript_53616/g.115831 Transcript_53616/m.115831 type:complete len:224 (+) Transcript_53616:575-1246(+)